MFKVLTGPRMNHLAGAASVSASPAADSNFPVANLYDGRPASPFKFGSMSSPLTISADLNRITDGGFESGVSQLLGSGGTLTQDSAQKNSGTYSAKLTHTAVASRYFDVEVQAAQVMTFAWAIRGDGTAAAKIQVANLSTGKYLKSDGTWSATPDDLDSQTTAAWKAGSRVFAVESVSQVGGLTCVLRVWPTLSASGSAWFDDFALYPSTDFFGIFGHNLTPACTVKLQSSTDGSSYSDEATATFARDVIFGSIGQVSKRYLRLSIEYTVPPAVPAFALGELVFGQALDLGRNPNYPVGIAFREPNIRLQTSGGTQWVMARGSAPLRTVTLSFDYFNDSDYQEARDSVYGTSRGGAYPLILVPTETDAGVAIFGRLDDSTTFRRDNYVQRTAEFVVQEEAFPWL